MKSFKFESVWLLSHRDKSARKETFHLKRTLILGINHTGKSTLIKTMFAALGATPSGELEKWDKNAIIAVGISIDGERFRIVHQTGLRGLFDSEGTLLLATGKHDEWSKKFSSLTGFNLVLSDAQKGESVPADPACFFLPFVIDQDGSWGAKWDTFPAVKRFKKAVRPILEYFSGIRPAEFYTLQAERNIVALEVKEHEKDMEILERTRVRLEKALPLGTVNLDGESFEREISLLTNKANVLNAKQELIRDKLVREAELVESLRHEIDIAHASLREFAGDKKYLKQSNQEPLECPTCGAQHEKSFLHYFSYAEDARVLEQLVIQLRQDLVEREGAHAKSRQELAALEEDYRHVADILQTRHGDLKFQQVVESYGSQAAQHAFAEERTTLANDLGDATRAIALLDARIKELLDKKRAREILNTFRAQYKKARVELNVPDPTAKTIGLVTRPNRSGSGGPRLLLAYYAAVWQVCAGGASGIAVPVVIDSPNQQDQDKINLPAVLHFISDSLPANIQLIVCLTDKPNVELDKTIQLDKPYALLERQQYDEVEGEIGPLYRAMNEALLSIR